MFLIKATGSKFLRVDMQPAASNVSSSVSNEIVKKAALKYECMNRIDARDMRKHWQMSGKACKIHTFCLKAVLCNINTLQEEVATACSFQNGESRVNHPPAVTRHYAVV